MENSRTISVMEVARKLGISRSKAYELTHRADFPVLKIGTRTIILRDKFEKWLDANINCGEGTHNG